MTKLIFLPLVLLISGCASISKADRSTPFRSCHDDKPRLEARSKELASIVQADQDDRKNWEHKSSDEMFEVAKRDVPRRQRVGEIFGEGCFSTAGDYSAAALVYQHGDVPDHFFQTFVWSKRAVELGDSTQKRTMALGIDRYLVNIGQKQLFGSQAFLPDFKPESCWCLQQIEKSYPDSLRKELAGKSLNEAFDWLKELNAGKTCPIGECTTQLKPSPKGTVPGFW